MSGPRLRVSSLALVECDGSGGATAFLKGEECDVATDGNIAFVTDVSSQFFIVISNTTRVCYLA